MRPSRTNVLLFHTRLAVRNAPAMPDTSVTTVVTSTCLNTHCSVTVTNAKQAAAQPDGSSSSTYECDACGRTFSSRREMKIHEHDCTGTTASSQTGDSPGTSLPDRGAKGTVTSYDSADGYGFIEMADRSDDVFFHVSDYDGHDPSEGDYLQFDLEHRDEGAKAVNLTDADADSVDQWDQKFASERPRWGKDQLE